MTTSTIGQPHIKVLHVIDSGGLYGAEVMLLNLMRAQLTLGINPVLVSIGLPGEPQKAVEIQAARAGLRVLSVRMKAGLNILGAINLFQLAKREKATLFHSHGYKANILLGLLPFGLRKIPLVATLHGWTWTGKLNRMMVYEWLDALSLRFIDRVVLVNEQMPTHRRLRGLSQSRLRSIANGIDIAAVEKKARAESDNALAEFIQRKFTVVGVGRFSHEKNFSALVDVVATLVANGLDLQLLLLGDGYERNSLEEQVLARNLTERVLMPGYVDNIAAYLQVAQVLAMPSLTEGLPMTLLEAMTLRLPVVASHVGGIPDALGDGLGGLLVPVADNTALQHAVADVYHDAEGAAARAGWARTQVEGRFSSQRMGKDYLRVYHEILQGG